MSLFFMEPGIVALSDSDKIERKLKDKYFITRIDNVGYMIANDCIEEIMNANVDVEFNTIQYVVSKNCIIFYTEENINIDSWINKGTNYNNRAKEDANKICTELVGLLKLKYAPKEDEVSLYELYKLMKSKYDAYYDLHRHFGKYIWFTDFNYDKMEMKIACSGNLERVYTIVFTKKDGELKLVSTDVRKFFLDKILARYKEEFLEVFDKISLFDDMFKYNKHRMRLVNTNFLVNIFPNSLEFLSRNGVFKITYEFCDKITDDCYYNDVCKIYNKKEVKLLKNTYIKISRCPMWTREILRENRKNKINHSFWYRLKNLKF